MPNPTPEPPARGAEATVPSVGAIRRRLLLALLALAAGAGAAVVAVELVRGALAG